MEEMTGAARGTCVDAGFKKNSNNSAMKQEEAMPFKSLSCLCPVTEL